MKQMFRQSIRVGLATGTLAVVVAAVPADAQVARALVRERGTLAGAPGGHTVNSINNTAVNHAGGYAVNVNTSDGVTTLSHIWGNASGGAGTVMRTEGTFGSLVQTAYESFYGISNTGQVSYSATGTGGPVGNFDSVWLDDTPIAVQGDPVPSLPGQYYVFASRPGVTADGKPYWSSGWSNTPGGSSQNRGLFLGAGANPVILGGSGVPNLPFNLITSSISFDYRMSEFGNHYIIPVTMTSGSTLHDDAIVVDGSGLMIAGSLVREQSPVPAAAGGLVGENWDNFDFCGINEAGDYFFSGDTEPATANDEFILKNGVIVYREGDSVDSQVLSGAIEGAYMNADGDIAYVWDIQGGVLEALYVNDQLLLVEGDLVDLTGDGVVDAGKKLADFTGISALTMGDRDNLGQVNVYFTADIDTAGTSSATDDVEGFFCLTATVDVPIAVTLESFEAAAERGGEVTLRWATSREQDHAGFHVYRGDTAEGPFALLSESLVQGRSPYSYTDAGAAAGTTYYYRLGAVDRRGNEELMGLVSVTAGAWSERTMLHANFPNPFRGATELRFDLATAGRAAVSVYDARGRLVRQLEAGERRAGSHVLRWDGRDDLGRAVAGGVYFSRLETTGAIQTQKMLLVRDE